MYTIYGYTHDFITRHIDDEIFNHCRDQLTVNLVTMGASKTSNTGLMGIIICCPVLTLHSYRFKPLITKLEKQLALPMRQWNVSECDVDGCVKLCIRFGEAS